MGNRAVVTFKDEDEPMENWVSIYLHWNGGRDSIESFLNTAKHFGVRGDSYGVARLTQIICNFFDGTLSVGVGLYKRLDTENWDNGVYVIDDKFNIIDRLHFDHAEQMEYDIEEMTASLIEKNKMMGDVLQMSALERLKKKIDDAKNSQQAQIEKLKDVLWEFVSEKDIPLIEERLNMK